LLSTHRTAAGGPLGLGEPAAQLVDRAALCLERPFERIDPRCQPHLFHEADDGEDRDGQADQREK
jgi:hypothetical protein